MSQGLDAKVDGSELATQLALKPDTSTMTTLLDAKAGADAVDALSGRLDAVTSTVDGKAERSTVTELSLDFADSDDEAGDTGTGNNGRKKDRSGPY